MKEPAHRAFHPFGQIRTYEEGDLACSSRGQLSSRLGDADWLDGEFSAGDLLMEVLLRLNGSGLPNEYPNLSAYVARGEARPAFRRAFDAQLAVFTGRPPAG